MAALAPGAESGRPVAPPPAARPKARNLKSELNTQLRRYIELKKHLRGVERGLRQVEAEMETLFDETGQDSLATEFGELTRRKGKDKTEWIIDL